MYPKLLSRTFENVITVEPDPLNFEILLANCTETNIIASNLAFGPTKGRGKIQRPIKTNVGMNYVEELSSMSLLNDVFSIIDVVTIDDYLEDLHPPITRAKIDLLMLDTEGSEYGILQGARRTIFEHRPVIFCERPNTNVVSLLDTLGYRQATTSAMDTVFIPWD